MASTISSASMTVTLTESLVLNGVNQGSTKKMTITGVTAISTLFCSSPLPGLGQPFGFKANLWAVEEPLPVHRFNTAGHNEVGKNPNITLGKFTGLYNKKQIEQVIIEVKLPPGLPSGYRSIPLPTQYKDHPRRILCRGSYQVWWVLRTPSEYIIEKRKTIYLTKPICDWDPFNKRYRPYATIARIDDYGALGPNPAAIGSDIVPVDAQVQFGKWWEESYDTKEIAVNKGFVFCDTDGNCNDATLVPPQRL